MNFFKSLFDGNERDIRKYRKVVDKINAIEPDFVKLTDDELKGKSDEFRQRLLTTIGDESQYKDRKALVEAYNRALDEILPEAFAACREASKRILGMRHFDVQLIGGMVQHDGRISELRTGEGKTLTCTLATYLNAIARKGVHVVTANDYLVKRDAVWMGPLYHALGMSVGILQGHSPETGDGGGTFIYDPEHDEGDPRFRHARQTFDRREAYACDILYATSAELGFDYLRDNMAPTLEQMVQQRGHWFAIIDECDSNLIDEARTPLIISGTAERSSDLYYVFTRLIPSLERGEAKKNKDDTETDEKDYTVDEKAKSASFTETGLDRIEALLARELEVENPAEFDISALENVQYMQHAVAALKAHAVFQNERDYVVKPNQDGKPEVVIVDEFTGRLMFGRRWSDGLHQAIEAKEGITIENEQQTLATITIQNYFRLYAKLAGMTGTAKTEEDEFRKIYALDVVQVPTNRPMVRKDQADVIYKSEEAKLRGIAGDLLRLWCKGQPVLVGTRSIAMSERVSARLTFQKLEVLGAALILRTALEERRKELGEKYAQMSAMVNHTLDELTVPALEPLARELSVSIRMNDPATHKRIAQILQIPDEQVERLSEGFAHGIPHNVLNAKYHEQEARIIAEAGRRGAVTIATNMAGRGVDILLGGSHYKNEMGNDAEQDFSYRRGGKRRSIAHTVTARDAAVDPETLGPAGAGTISLGDDETPHDTAAEREAVKALGGLFILGTERHESRRIDNQLRGRSGRQGDPGESRFHVSLEDYLWRVFGDRQNSVLMRQWEEDQAVDMPILSKMIERAQKKVEQHNFDQRKNVLEYDDVMNVQREVIYSERRKILAGADLKDTALAYLAQSIESSVGVHCPDGVAKEEWDRDALYNELNEQFPLANFADFDELNTLDRNGLIARLNEIGAEAYVSKEDELGQDMMREVERHFARQAIDRAWIDHLASMDYLREGIGLRGYAQTDPLVAYKKEALELFDQMQGHLMGDALKDIFRAQVQQEIPDEQSIYDLLAQFESGGGLPSADGYEAYDENEPESAVAMPTEEINALRNAVAEAAARQRQQLEEDALRAAAEQFAAQSETTEPAPVEPVNSPILGVAPARRRKKTGDASGE